MANPDQKDSNKDYRGDACSGTPMQIPDFGLDNQKSVFQEILPVIIIIGIIGLIGIGIIIAIIVLAVRSKK